MDATYDSVSIAALAAAYIGQIGVPILETMDPMSEQHV